MFGVIRTNVGFLGYAPDRIICVDKAAVLVLLALVLTAGLGFTASAQDLTLSLDLAKLSYPVTLQDLILAGSRDDGYSRDGGYSLDEFERGHGETEAGLEDIKAFINAYYPSEEDRLAYRDLFPKPGRSS